MESYYNYDDAAAGGESYWDRNLEESESTDYRTDYYSENSDQYDNSVDAASNLFSSSNVFVPANVDSDVTEVSPLATTSVYEQAKQTWDVIFEEDEQSSVEVSLSNHNECCGVYPKRAPIQHKGHQTRSCCHDVRTYDQSLHSCCDDGRVVAFGSC